jgi:Fe-S-cluster containining protein
MEFTLDIARLREILAQEYARAGEDIRSLGPVSALAVSGQRHDQRVAAADDIDTLACRTGCAWCCHFTIDVRPAEVFRILDYMRQSLSSEEQGRVFSEVHENSRLMSALADGERAMKNVKCPFLSQGQCAIYEARPQSCRNYHATDVAGCRRSYEEPENLEIDPEFAPGVYQAGGAHVEAFSAAMRDAGYDESAYELNSALAIALSQVDARERFEARRLPFVGLTGEEVVAEFDDLV